MAPEFFFISRVSKLWILVFSILLLLPPIWTTYLCGSGSVHKVAKYGSNLDPNPRQWQHSLSPPTPCYCKVIRKAYRQAYRRYRHSNTTGAFTIAEQTVLHHLAIRYNPTPIEPTYPFGRAGVVCWLRGRSHLRRNSHRSRLLHRRSGHRRHLHHRHAKGDTGHPHGGPLSKPRHPAALLQYFWLGWVDDFSVLENPTK